MGTITTITAPTSEPVTLTEVKDALRVDTNDDDARLSSIITAAREYAELYLNLRLKTQVVELSMELFPGQEFNLDVWPLQSVDSVKYDDTASPVTEQTLAVDLDYYADVTIIGGSVRTISGWPATANKPNAIRVRMTAGYLTDVPYNIKEGIILYAGFLYDGDESNEKAAMRMLWPKRRI